MTSEQSLDVAALAYQLLQTNLKLLDQANSEYSGYIAAITKQDSLQKELLRVNREYRDFINKNLVWSRSADMIPANAPEAIKGFVKWLTDTKNWTQTGRDILLTVKRRAGLYVLLLAALAVLVGLRRHLRTLIPQLKLTAKNAGKDTIGRDVLVVFLTIINQIGIPLLLLFALQVIVRTADTSLLANALCAAFASLLGAIMLARLALATLRQDGVALLYFRWPSDVCNALSQHIQHFKHPFYVLIALLSFIHNAPQILQIRDTLGRLVFMITMLLAFFVLRRILHRDAPLPAWLKKRFAGTSFTKYYSLYALPLLYLPMALFLFAGIGFYFSAYSLAKNVALTLYLLLGILVLDGLFKRALRLAEVRLAILKKEADKKAQQVRQPHVDADPLAVSVENTVTEVPEIDSIAISQDIMLLIRSVVTLIAAVSAWLVWADVIPAANMLSQVHLWSSQFKPSADSEPIVVFVTLLNIVEAAIWLTVLVVGSKTIPTLLDVLLSRYSKMDNGARNATRILCGYLVSIIGIVGIFNALHISWSKFQWLAAAMTFGLSFGLQEIFANFVSGIVILFERPIRIGDTVTVKGTSGTVTRIRMRATTVVDWDRKEVVIPNKSFLVDNIINWSLSDDIGRIVIEVGVAYGGDIKQAEAILLELAATNPLILETPAPSVLFTGFGADSLDLNLRIFTAMANRVKVQHQLRHEINQRFSEAGIEIPFAQRDTHLDTPRPLDIRILPPD